MHLSDTVTEALGGERTRAVERGVSRILGLARNAPDETTAVVHLPVRLSAQTDEAACRELQSLLERTSSPGEGWAYLNFETSEGQWFAEITPYVARVQPGKPSWMQLLRLSELYTRLNAYRLSNLWRAAELTSASAEALGAAHSIVAASCARALLEGAAKFQCDVADFASRWHVFKQRDNGNINALDTFVETFRDNITQSQYGSRIGEKSGVAQPLKSKNVIGYLNRLIEGVSDYNVSFIYEVLCDAVHPSFGSTSAYTAVRSHHKSNAYVLELFARCPLEVGENDPDRFPPLVLSTAADAIIVATRSLYADLIRSDWLLHDIGFTSEAAFLYNEPFPGRLPRPGQNELCPCGSSRKFKRCRHRWGLSGLPPDVIDD